MLQVRIEEERVFRRASRPLVMAEPVPLPTGNVEVVTAPPEAVRRELPTQRGTQGRTGRAGSTDLPTSGWTIRNVHGEVVFTDMPTRAAASRMLGVLAVNGAWLPLIVHGPDGRATGERLG
jgi:hypothetical protein